MITTRVKLILLIILNTAIIFLPAKSYYSFIAILLIYNLAFYKSLFTNFKTIFIYLLGFFLIAILLNYLLGESNLLSIVPDFLKLFTIINISILLITEINIMELVATISVIKIPTRIAIAFGVGFRYFPLLLNDIRRIHFIQSTKGYGLNFKSFKTHGFISSMTVFLTPLFLSILRRTDNIALSVTIQQIEDRAKKYTFHRVSIYEFSLLLVSITFLLYSIILKFQLL